MVHRSSLDIGIYHHWPPRVITWFDLIFDEVECWSLMFLYHLFWFFYIIFFNCSKLRRKVIVFFQPIRNFFGLSFYCLEPTLNTKLCPLCYKQRNLFSHFWAVEYQNKYYVLFNIQTLLLPKRMMWSRWRNAPRRYRACVDMTRQRDF